MGTASAEIAISSGIDENNNINYAAAVAANEVLPDDAVEVTETPTEGSATATLVGTSSDTVVAATAGVMGDRSADTVAVAVDGTVTGTLTAASTEAGVSAGQASVVSGDLALTESTATDHLLGTSAGTMGLAVNGEIDTDSEVAEAGSNAGVTVNNVQVTDGGAGAYQDSYLTGDKVIASSWSTGPDGDSSSTSVGAQGTPATFIDQADPAHLDTVQVSGADQFVTVATQVSQTTGDSAWAYTAASDNDHIMWWNIDRQSAVDTWTSGDNGNMHTVQTAMTDVPGPFGTTHTLATATVTAGGFTDVNVVASYEDPANWFYPVGYAGMGAGAGDGVDAGATTGTGFMWLPNDHVWAMHHF